MSNNWVVAVYGYHEYRHTYEQGTLRAASLQSEDKLPKLEHLAHIILRRTNTVRPYEVHNKFQLYKVN